MRRRRAKHCVGVGGKVSRCMCLSRLVTKPATLLGMMVVPLSTLRTNRMISTMRLYQVYLPLTYTVLMRFPYRQVIFPSTPENKGTIKIPALPRKKPKYVAPEQPEASSEVGAPSVGSTLAAGPDVPEDALLRLYAWPFVMLFKRGYLTCP